ncbi:MAG TPA: molybdopterin-dependent oxidoreductase [Nocardioides sp.]|uniref:molybdopterin-dependent oxidoreductase n=1 Tax=Nocardioides sp. TaxID=35761 RepID=UPI002C80D293|nr:molybdopterin-dependent oxidoreductase [Nocardioides sp.]HTW16015.1 molybdopterin-dependent oxidoreductase [Nocardioides sp.]
MRTRLAYAASGVLATLVAVALAHLVAGLTDPAASPVLAVGSQVIDLTPTPLKEWAIQRFGTRDKPILVGSVFAGVLVLSAVAGLLARRRTSYGAALLVVLVLLAAGATLNRPRLEALDLLPSLVAAVTAVLVLVLLTRPRGDRAAAGGRRGVLMAGALAALAVAAGGAGEWIARARTRIADVALPAAADPAPPLPAGIEGTVEGVTPFRTPNGDFYRVDTRLTLPVIDLDDWTLTIDGDVDREVTFTFDDLLELSMVERDITLTCVSNDVGGKYVGAARWLGVPLRDLLDRAGIDGTGADQILSTDVEGMTISTPLDLALDGRDALLAVGMNGDPLPLEHGFPARLVIPGLYGFISATKWISRLTLTTYAEQDAYWTKRKWATDAPIKISSRIDTPKSLSTIDAGPTFVGGVAWAQQRGGVAKVEVRIDGGPWQPATLGPDGGNDYWRQWYLPWDATSGSHSLAVRATSGDGETQTAVRATPFPAGSSGVQETRVQVS